MTNPDYQPCKATVGRINGEDSFGVDGGRIVDLMRDYEMWGLLPGGEK
ncbi:MAG TPA: hypothetical protein VEY92_08545 [Pseudoxanthomonas sp.]|nr:hypothetical protein [Pseudoxanthomonas sp.]